MALSAPCPESDAAPFSGRAGSPTGVIVSPGRVIGTVGAGAAEATWEQPTLKQAKAAKATPVSVLLNKEYSFFFLQRG